MGCPASQYSYEVYAPGVSIPVNDVSPFLPYNGMPGAFGNGYGPKSICVGFNGNYHLAGKLGPEFTYTGTWNAWDSAQEGNPLFENEDRLSFDVDWLPKKYAATWLAIAPGKYKKGTDTIKVDLPTNAPSDLLKWWIGQQLLVLACPQQYTTQTPRNTTGILPIWINNSDETQRTANEDANKKFLNARGQSSQSIGGGDPNVPGVEVMTVKTVSSDGTITFEDKFRFDHSASRTKLHRKFGKGVNDIYVDTVPHVCILSRNIVITSELRAGKGGCNVVLDKFGELGNGMASGKAGRSTETLLIQSGAIQPKTTESSPLDLPQRTASINGPGGSMVCNTRGDSTNSEIFATCYKNPGDPSYFCGNESLPTEEKNLEGHWLWGTHGMQGCGTIHGGQHMFRNGCAINIDSVEIKRLGTPGNFGSIAQYAIHFHLCGYGRAFTGYLPENATYPRKLRVVNSSIWLSLSRWITLHGTSEADISNNVGFMTFGSGYFVEDGAEYGNTFDHNVGAYAVPAVKNEYLNSSPLYPNVSSDYGQMSVFWMKNNGNVQARNVACCSPGATIGFWMVPQIISQLRGPSCLCLGSEKLKLPGFGSMQSAVGTLPIGSLSPKGNNNKNHEQPSVSTTTACWVPEGFQHPLARVNSDKCMANSSNNVEIPWLGFMENVNYCTFMLIGEMPEMIHLSSLPYDLSPGGTIGLGAQIQDNKSQPQWIPYNGLNACSDTVVGVYSQTEWTEDHPCQPIDDLTEHDKHTQSQEIKARSIPKILSGVLSFCTGGFQGLWGGTGWTKQMAVWTLNCAYIDTAADAENPVDLFNAQGKAPGVPSSTSASTAFIQTIQSNTGIFNKMYPVFHNFICNGRVSLPPSPTLWTGKHTFLSDTATFFNPGEEGMVGHLAVQKHFCDFGKLTIQDIFSNPFPMTPSVMGTKDPPSIFLYDVNIKQLATIKWSDGSWTVEDKEPPEGSSTKFPYICDKNKLRTFDGVNSSFNEQFKLSNVLANLVTAQFYTTAGKNLGDSICNGIFKIPSNLSTRSWP
jgi:hypothetical protein